MAKVQEPVFITEINIQKIRHLKDVTIPLDDAYKQNLILTGGNGSGKTSVLHRLADHLDLAICDTLILNEPPEGSIDVKLFASATGMSLRSLKKNGFQDRLMV